MLEVDLDADFGCGGEVLGVGGEAIRDIDHRAGTVISEPEAGLDPRLRARIAVTKHGGHFLAGAEMLERQCRPPQKPRHPYSVAFVRTRATYRPGGFTNDAHIDDVLRGAGEITSQHFRFEVVQHGGDTGHDVGGRIVGILPVPRDTQGYERAERPGTLRREVGQRGPRGTKTDFLEVEPVGPEVDVLERVVDAEREGCGAQRNQRAVVTEVSTVAGDLGDPLNDAADTIELFAGTEIHGTFIFTTPLEPQVPLELEVWRATHPEGPPGHRLGAGCGPSIAGPLARRLAPERARPALRLPPAPFPARGTRR